MESKPMTLGTAIDTKLAEMILDEVEIQAGEELKLIESSANVLKQSLDPNLGTLLDINM